MQQPDAAPAEAPSRKRAADAQEESADTSDSAPSPKRHRANPAAASQEADTSDSPGEGFARASQSPRCRSAAQ